MRCAHMLHAKHIRPDPQALRAHDSLLEALPLRLMCFVSSAECLVALIGRSQRLSQQGIWSFAGSTAECLRVWCRVTGIMTVMRIAHPALLLAASLLHCCDAKPFQCIFKVDGGAVTLSSAGPLAPSPTGCLVICPASVAPAWHDAPCD